MFLKQLSVFLENSKGRLKDVTKILAENDIDIRAFGIADTESFGIMRMILNDPDKAYACLMDKGITAMVSEVIGVMLAHKPGAMHEMLGVLFENDLSIEYSYAYLTHDDADAVIIIKTSDDKKSVEALTKAGFTLL